MLKLLTVCCSHMEMTIPLSCQHLVSAYGREEGKLFHTLQYVAFLTDRSGLHVMFDLVAYRPQLQ